MLDQYRRSRIVPDRFLAISRADREPWSCLTAMLPKVRGDRAVVGLHLVHVARMGIRRADNEAMLARIQGDKAFRLPADAELQQQSAGERLHRLVTAKATDRIYATDATVALAIAGLPPPPTEVSQFRTAKPGGGYSRLRVIAATDAARTGVGSGVKSRQSAHA